MLKALEYVYLFKMMMQGYQDKYTALGNDSHSIDVAVMMRTETAHGESIEFVRMNSHAHAIFEEFGLHTPRSPASSRSHSTAFPGATA